MADSLGSWPPVVPAGGLFFTTDEQWGLFGSASVGAGFVGELSAGMTVFVYWPDHGKSGLDNFKGSNVSASVGITVGVAVGGGLSWPSKAFIEPKPSSYEPCGIAISLGGGVGYPFNFIVANSQTWVAMNPPVHFPPPHGH